MRPCTHASMHPCIRACIHASVHACMHTCACTHNMHTSQGYISSHTVVHGYMYACQHFCMFKMLSFLHLFRLIHVYISTSSTAQGGGESFNKGNLEERLAVVNQKWQSESTNGPTGAWSVVVVLVQCSVL